MAKASGEGGSAKQPESARAAIERRSILSALGSRDEAKPGNPVQIRAVVNELRPAMALHAEQDGRLGHGYGSRIAWFFGVRADEVLGRADFTEFLSKDLGLTLRVANRYVRVAKVATAEQAAWGLNLVLDIATILDLFASEPALRKAFRVPDEPRTINDLAGIEFKLADKRRVRFDQGRPNAVDVDALLAELRERASAKLARLSRDDVDVNARLRAACATDPRLEGVEAGIKRTRKGHRFVISLPTGANLDKVTRALRKALEDGT